MRIMLCKLARYLARLSELAPPRSLKSINRHHHTSSSPAGDQLLQGYFILLGYQLQLCVRLSSRAGSSAPD